MDCIRLPEGGMASELPVHEYRHHPVHKPLLKAVQS